VSSALPSPTAPNLGHAASAPPGQGIGGRREAARNEVPAPTPFKSWVAPGEFLSRRPWPSRWPRAAPAVAPEAAAGKSALNDFAARSSRRDGGQDQRESPCSARSRSRRRCHRTEELRRRRLLPTTCIGAVCGNEGRAARSSRTRSGRARLSAGRKAPRCGPTHWLVLGHRASRSRRPIGASRVEITPPPPQSMDFMQPWPSPRVDGERGRRAVCCATSQ